MLAMMISYVLNLNMFMLNHFSFETVINLDRISLIMLGLLSIVIVTWKIRTHG